VTVVSDLLGLEGKVAIVSGGGGNIGRATVLMLARAGARVLAVDLDGARAKETAAIAGDGVVALEADATADREADRMVSTALSHWGRLDVGVNVVGGGAGFGPVLEMADIVWESTMNLNLYSTVRCSRAYARAMIGAGNGGSIVNIASPAGLRAAPTMGPYGAAKAAVISFTWTLAVELARDGIRVNTVVPAFVPNATYEFGGSPEERDALARRVVPMGRTTTAEDVAGAIICFASQLTSFSTGQMIVCDGGRLLTNPIFGPVGEAQG
jgi:NAD(P)-dependent dehydrogenase (short-subunit alcohol dehydrogenase family)